MSGTRNRGSCAPDTSDYAFLSGDCILLCKKLRQTQQLVQGDKIIQKASGILCSEKRNAISDQSRDTGDSYGSYGTVHLLYGEERDMDSLHYNCGRLGCTRGLLHVFCKNDKE